MQRRPTARLRSSGHARANLAGEPGGGDGDRVAFAQGRLRDVTESYFDAKALKKNRFNR